MGGYHLIAKSKRMGIFCNLYTWVLQDSSEIIIKSSRIVNTIKNNQKIVKNCNRYPKLSIKDAKNHQKIVKDRHFPR